MANVYDRTLVTNLFLVVYVHDSTQINGVYATPEPIITLGPLLHLLRRPLQQQPQLQPQSHAWLTTIYGWRIILLKSYHGST